MKNLFLDTIHGIVIQNYIINKSRVLFIPSIYRRRIDWTANGTKNRGKLYIYSTCFLIGLSDSSIWNSCINAIIVLIIFILLYFMRIYEKEKLNDRAERLRLKEMDQLKSRLYTNITHEFRTPLTIIMGMIDNIKGYNLERLLIRRNSRKMLLLINQMLDLSQLDFGIRKLDNQQSDIIKYLKYLTESFYNLAKSKGINLTFNSQKESMYMDYDENKLQHVYYNLVSNALKFTDKGGKVTLIVNEVLKENWRALEVKIQDSGKGISKENLPFIFDRFYHLDDSQPLLTEGRGLGLSIAKEYVELMGGRISVKSKQGEGSEFTIYLPISNEAPLLVKEIFDEDMGEILMVDRINETEVFDENKPLVLIIDDNKDVIVYLTSLLLNDYNIRIAYDGEEGVGKAIELIPDIIICDVMMPLVDGYKVTLELKKHELTSHIPIIIITARSGMEERIRGLEAGADAYLTKPFNKKEILVRIKKLINLRSELRLRFTMKKQPKFAHEQTDDLETIFLNRVTYAVEQNLDNAEYTVTQLCRSINLSQPQLYRKLMAITGKSPSIFIRSIRLKRAAEMLRCTNLNVSEIAWKTGFNDPSYFARIFHRSYGSAPSEWRNSILKA